MLFCEQFLIAGVAVLAWGHAGNGELFGEFGVGERGDGWFAVTAKRAAGRVVI